jgi:nicotinate-nucleotide adenylyltransferase
MPKTLTRIGVLGGTFDPPHLGHLVAAVNVRHALQLDLVLLMVANEPWQKVGSRSITDAEIRFAMVSDAVGDAEGLMASRIEIDRGGPSFMADTLNELKARHPGAELFLLLGSDSAAGLTTWERWEEVARLAAVVVVNRPGQRPAEALAGWRWNNVDVPAIEASSTDLRSRVLEGRPLEFLTPPLVIERIRSLRLYQAAA